MKVDNGQLRAIIEADSLTTTREVAKELNVNHSMVVQNLKQIGKVKKLDKWVPHELTANQKNHFEVQSSLIARKNNKLFRDQIMMCDEKENFIQTAGDDKLSVWTKKKLQSTSQSQTCIKKGSQSPFGGLLLIPSTTAF